MAPQHTNIFSRVFFGVLRFIRNYFIFVGVLVTLGWVATIILISKGSKMEIESPLTSLSSTEPSALWLELSGKVSEEEPSFSQLIFAKFMGSEHEVYLPKLRLALKRAAKDDRIKELIINVMPVSASAAEYASLRKAIADYREASGKPVRVFMADISDWNYYIASAGTNITLNPTGAVALPGPAFQLIYFGDALKKLGVSIDVVRAGKYKSAFEPFIQNKPSEPTLEEYNSMQKSLLDHIVAAVSNGRGKDESTVRGWYKKSFFTTEEAVKTGIVDNVGYTPQKPDDEDYEAPATKPGQPKVEQEIADAVEIEDYLAATKHDKHKQEQVTNKGGIALIDAIGQINLTSRSAGPTSDDEGINPDDMRRQLRWALENPEVKAVVLRISSPGGSAVASDMIWNDVRILANAKPLVVSMGAYAASGGYYIAAPAKRIFAEPTTVTGSIGVIGMLPSAEGFEDKWGVSFHMISSSDRKQLLDLGSKATAEDKALLEKNIAAVYKTFIQKVAEGRNMPIEKVEAIAQGRVYTGLQGKDIGLVDEIGGADAALRSAKELAGFDKDKLYPVLRYKDKGFSLSDCLKRPSQIAQCLKHAGVRSGAPKLLSATALDGPEKVARTVAAWALAPQRERTLTLWSGYLSLVWQ